MMRINIPGRDVLEIHHLVLDMNGTLSLDGKLLEGVSERIEALRSKLEILIVTADTQGTAQQIAAGLGVQLHKIDAARQPEQKLAFIKQLGSQVSAAIGNGANDALMLKEAALGICIVGPEGAASEAISACDVVVSDINSALDLLLKPKRLIATLRK